MPPSFIGAIGTELIDNFESTSGIWVGGNRRGSAARDRFLCAGQRTLRRAPDPLWTDRHIHHLWDNRRLFVAPPRGRPLGILRVCPGCRRPRIGNRDIRRSSTTLYDGTELAWRQLVEDEACSSLDSRILGDFLGYRCHRIFWKWSWLSICPRWVDVRYWFRRYGRCGVDGIQALSDGHDGTSLLDTPCSG